MPDVTLCPFEPPIAIVLGEVCGSDPPQPHPAIAALLGRFLPRLGPLVATQAAFLFVCTPIGFSGPLGSVRNCGNRATAPIDDGWSAAIPITSSRHHAGVPG